MNFAIIDDEPEILSQISDMIQEQLCDTDYNTECFQSSSDFLTIYSVKEYNALFLDIDMPGINGFELAESLRSKNDHIPIVYITAKEDLVFEAFRYKVLGFVRKQYLKTELPLALSTVLKELNKVNDIIVITETRSAGKRSHTIHVKDILYLESSGHNVIIHLVNNHILTCRNSISYYANHKQFKDFEEITSGVMVNLSLIDLSDEAVILPDGKELFISRRKLPSVRTAYLNHIRRLLI